MSQEHAGMSREEAIKAISAVIQHIKFAMLTVALPEGQLQAHPMTTQQTEFNGDLWFIGGKNTQQVQSMLTHPQVNITYSDHSKGNYVSLSGTAQLVQNQAKLEEMWSDAYKAYFPGGLSDPNIQLIKIEVQGGEYWGSDGKLKHFFQMARAAITGKPATNLGRNETIRF